jgi:hypothetical protein
MKPILNSYILILSIFLASIASAQVEPLHRTKGGEGGNPRQEYTNALLGFSASYPENWSLIDLEESVSFFDSRSGQRPDVAVQIAKLENPSAQTLTGLKGFLDKAFPNLHWKETTFNNYPAVASLGEAEGHIYILIRPTKVGAISFLNELRDRENEVKIREILSTVRFKNNF